MERSKRVVFLSHCIINQNTVVNPLARTKGAYKDVLKVIMDKEIGFHQMSCPEFRHLGINRLPMTKDEYDTIEYRNLCKNFAKDTLGIIREYINSGYEVVGVLGIKDSPTCSISGSRGIYMEELFQLLDYNNISLEQYEIPIGYYDGDRGRDFIEFLKNKL